jgi:hypothetical protein
LRPEFSLLENSLYIIDQQSPANPEIEETMVQKMSFISDYGKK